MEDLIEQARRMGYREPHLCTAVIRLKDNIIKSRLSKAQAYCELDDQPCPTPLAWCSTCSRNKEDP